MGEDSQRKEWEEELVGCPSDLDEIVLRAERLLSDSLLTRISVYGERARTLRRHLTHTAEAFREALKGMNQLMLEDIARRQRKSQSVEQVANMCDQTTPPEAAVTESVACAETPVTRLHLTERFCRAVAMFMDTLSVPEDTPAELVDDWYAMRARLRRTLQEAPGNYERAMAYEEHRRNVRKSR